MKRPILTLLKTHIYYIENAQLPEPENEPNLFELVKTYQIHSHSRTCWKYNKNECRLLYGPFSVIKQSFQNRLTLGKIFKKERNCSVEKDFDEKVKSYIDNHLNPATVNIIDPRKKFCTAIEHS